MTKKIMSEDKEKELKKDEELNTEEKDNEVKEESEVKKEDEKPEDVEKPESDIDSTIVLDSGAVVDEEEQPESTEELVTITKEDGTKIYVDKVETDSEEEKKEIYEAIVEADSNESGFSGDAEEVSEEILENVNDDIEKPIELGDDEDVEEVSYIGAACNNHKASLDNSFFLFKTKSGKIHAVKAGKLLSKNLKASILSKIIRKQEVPSQESIISKIASQNGLKISDFKRYAKKLTSLAKETVKKVASLTKPQIGDIVEINKKEFKIVASKGDSFILNNGKKVVADELIKSNTAEIKDDSKTTNDTNKQLENFSIQNKDIEEAKFDSQIAIDGKESKQADGEDVKSAKSKIKNFYGRLPSKSNVGSEPVWGLKDFNGLRNKTVASQIKSMREMAKSLRAEKEAKLKALEEVKALQAKLDAIESSKAAMLKHSKIEKILAAMNIVDPQQKFVMEKKFASYNDSQLNAVYDTLTTNVDEETNNIHEQMMNDELKREASLLEGRVPAIGLQQEEVSSNEVDYVELLARKAEEEYSK